MVLHDNDKSKRSMLITQSDLYVLKTRLVKDIIHTDPNNVNSAEVLSLIDEGKELLKQLRQSQK